MTVAWRPQTEEEARRFRIAAKALFAVWAEALLEQADEPAKKGEKDS